MFKKLSLIVASGILSVSIVPTDASAEKFYKWVDEDGTTHYGTRPPADKQTEKVKVSNTQSSSSNLDQDRLDQSRDKMLQDKIDKQNSAEADAVKKEEDEYKKQIAENCKVYKSNLNTLQNSPRIKQTDKDGNVTYLGDEARKQEIEDTKKFIQENCS